MRFRSPHHVASWLLYLVALIALPTPYLIATVGFLLPMAALRGLVQRVPLPLPACSRECSVMIALVGGLVLVFAAMLYLGAAGASRLLVWAFTRKLAGLLLAGM